MTIRFWNRGFTKQISFPGVRFEVLRMEWELEGGCSKALVSGQGDAGQAGAVIAVAALRGGAVQ